MKNFTSSVFAATVLTLAVISISELILNTRLTGVHHYGSSQDKRVSNNNATDSSWAADIRTAAAAAFLATVTQEEDGTASNLEAPVYIYRMVSSNASETGSKAPVASSPPVASRAMPSNSAPNMTTTSNGIKSLMKYSFWGENELCNTIQSPSFQSPATVEFTFGCNELYEKSTLGTGNWMASVYAMRMAALAHGNVAVRMTCPDADAEKKNLIFPWLMGNFSAQPIPSTLLSTPAPSLQKACGDYNTSPIGYMIPYMRHELRRMAIALVGVPSQDHAAAAFAAEYMQSPATDSSSNGMGIQPQVAATTMEPPLFPDAELDDAVLHFRCGDFIMLDHRSYGFIKFSAYSKRLAPNTTTIGIVTQPFDTPNAQNRKQDAGKNKQQLCRDLVYLFQEHLADRFPNARIRIHNDRNETIALTYARMIMAKQVISPMSTFSVFAALATFGRGSIRKPDFAQALNKWLKTPTPVDELYDNVELVNEPDRLMGWQVKKLRQQPGGEANVHEWFQAPRASDLPAGHVPVTPASLEPGAPVMVVAVDDIKSLTKYSYWGDNEFCKVVENVTTPISPPMLVNFTFGCKKLFDGSMFGTGNWLSSFYAMRMVALVHGGIDVRMTCPDAQNEKMNLIVPWLMGYFPAHQSRLSKKNGPSLEQACEDYNKSPIGYMIPYVQHDLRRMAVALVGVPTKDHPAATFAAKYMKLPAGSGMGTELQVAAKELDKPLFPDVELDDAILHFRCGDLIMSNHPSFGFIKFSAFSKRLTADTKSIGIVTQPFDADGQSRREDKGPHKQEKCKEIVYSFQEHLAEHFPNARIRIHNDRNETIALTYARMIMAKQVISPISSFSVFPALATFGRGYIRKPDFAKAPNPWLNTPPVDELYDNIKLMVEPNILMTWQVKELRRMSGGAANVIEWFRNDTFCLKTCYE